MSEKIAIRLVDLRRSALFAIQAVAGNVRRGQHTEFGQCHIDLRLTLPDIEHRLQVFTLQQHLAQGAVIHHGTTTGIDQPGAGLESVQVLLIEQMPGRMRALLGQRRVQADDIALFDDLLQADVIASFGGLARRIADQYLPAQPLQDLDQASAHFTGADHTVSSPSQIDAFDFSQGQQTAEHVVDHATGIATRRAGPGDPGLLKIIQIQVIGANGAGTDKTHLAAFEQRAVDVGHRAHQQHIGLFDGGSVDGTPWHPADFTETCKESIEQGDIFVGNNQHGRLLRRIGSVGVEAGGEPACIVHPGYEGLHISCGEGA